MELLVAIARLPRNVRVLSRRENERAVILRLRPIDAVGHIARIGSDAARMGAGWQSASAGSTVAIVEHHGEARAAIENAIEEWPQFFVANVSCADARIGGNDRLV